MITLKEILKLADVSNMDKYKDTMEYCKKRVTADEGIPAIIGLDDLTVDGGANYTGSKEDEGLNYEMAVGALIFAMLYETSDGYQSDEYPAIAPAMSAVAEQFFLAVQPEDNKDKMIICPYREVVKEFIKE